MFAVFWFFAGLSSLGIAEIALGMDFGSEGWGFESLRRADFSTTYANEFPLRLIASVLYTTSEKGFRRGSMDAVIGILCR